MRPRGARAAQASGSSSAGSGRRRPAAMSRRRARGTASSRVPGAVSAARPDGSALYAPTRLPRAASLLAHVVGGEGVIHGAAGRRRGARLREPRGRGGGLRRGCGGLGGAPRPCYVTVPEENCLLMTDPGRVRRHPRRAQGGSSRRGSATPPYSRPPSAAPALGAPGNEPASGAWKRRGLKG